MQSYISGGKCWKTGGGGAVERNFCCVMKVELYEGESGGLESPTE